MDKMIDILMISPSNEKLGLFRRFVPRSVPLGLGILSGFLMQNGYNPEIADSEIIKINEKFLKSILNKMSLPRIFGISSMTTNASQAFEIAKKIKSLDKDNFVIMGGIHPTVCPEECLNTGYVDFVVIGEGEHALLSLVTRIKNNKNDFSGIANIAFKIGNNINFAEPSKELFNVNEIKMFPYDLFDRNKYDLGFILTSRGCPYDCIFCSQRVITKRKYRPRINELVIDELDYLINHLEQKNITFFDDFFTGDKKRVFELCKMIRERGLNKKCSFGVQTRGDSVTKEILVEMKNSGFDSMMLGFETVSDHLMKVINKNETVEDNVNAILLGNEIGLSTEATFIFGFPEENYKNRINALHLTRAVELDRARFNIATPYPGTKFYDIAVAQQKLNKADNWDNFSSAAAVTGSIFKKYKVPYCPEGTKPLDLSGEVFLANLLFYIYPKKLLKLFNPKKKGSGKWFEFPLKKIINPLWWINLFALIAMILIKTLYYLLVSNECKRFFISGFFKSSRKVYKKEFDTK